MAPLDQGSKLGISEIQNKDFELDQRWGRTAIFSAIITAALFVGLVASHFEYTPDDAYIYFQYAKKITQGKGFSFNASEPSYGTTGPLWALYIAGGTKIGLTPYAVAKSSDLVFAILSLVAVYLLASEILRSAVYGFLASIIFSMDAWFIRWTGSGMETSFAVFLSVTAVWLAVRKHYYATAFVCGCLTLTRPEGGLLFVIIFVRSFFNVSNGNRSAFDRSLPALCYGAIVLPWLVFSYFHFGKLVPNTFYGKSGGFLIVKEILPSLVTIIKVLAVTQLPLIAIFLASVFIKKEESLWEDKHLLLFWIVALPAFYISSSVQVVSRYLLIVFPFLVIAGLAGIQHLGRALQLSQRQVSVLILVVVALTFAQNQIFYWSKVKPALDHFIVGTNDCLKPIGRWLRITTKENAIVFVPDVGIIGYFSDRYICDAGLVTPEVGNAFQGLNYDTAMIQKRYNALVYPDYVIDRFSIPERLTSSSLLPVLVRQFPGLGISNTEIRYYTVYKNIK